MSDQNWEKDQSQGWAYNNGESQGNNPSQGINQSRGGYGQSRGGHGQLRGGYGQSRGGYEQFRGGYGQSQGPTSNQSSNQSRGGHGQLRGGYDQSQDQNANQFSNQMRGGYGQSQGPTLNQASNPSRGGYGQSRGGFGQSQGQGASRSQGYDPAPNRPQTYNQSQGPTQNRPQGYNQPQGTALNRPQGYNQPQGFSQSGNNVTNNNNGNNSLRENRYYQADQERKGVISGAGTSQDPMVIWLCNINKGYTRPLNEKVAREFGQHSGHRYVWIRACAHNTMSIRENGNVVGRLTSDMHLTVYAGNLRNRPSYQADVFLVSTGEKPNESWRMAKPGEVKLPRDSLPILGRPFYPSDF